MYDEKPEAIWVAQSQLRREFEICFNGLCSSFSRYDVDKVIPYINTIWPELDTTITGCVVPEQFPVKNRRRARREKKGDSAYRTSVPIPRMVRRRLRYPKQRTMIDGSSDEEFQTGTYTVRDIVLEAQDNKTKGIYLYVLWDSFDDNEGSWVPERDLNPATRAWWIEERMRRFPLCDYADLRPTMYITSRPMPELIVDDSSTSSSPPRLSSSSSTEESPFDQTDAFEIECILKERKVRGQIQYRVKWKGYPKRDARWVADHMVNSAAREAWNRTKGDKEKK